MLIVHLILFLYEIIEFEEVFVYVYSWQQFTYNYSVQRDYFYIGLQCMEYLDVINLIIYRKYNAALQ